MEPHHIRFVTNVDDPSGVPGGGQANRRTVLLVIGAVVWVVADYFYSVAIWV